MFTHSCWALLTALSLLPALAHADRPANTADIDFTSRDFRADGVISQDPPGACRSGFAFLSDWGGCVRQSTESSAESRSCPAGQTGTQTRSRSRTAYAHQNGGVQRGAWSGWTSWQGACRTVTPSTPPPSPPVSPTGPKVGQDFVIPRTISAMVCGPGDEGYAAGNNALVQETYRDQLIRYYRNFGLAGRCPEVSGYGYWLNDWFMRAAAVATPQFHAPGGNPRNLGWAAYVNTYMGNAWYDIRMAIDASAAENDEAGQGGMNAANGLCQRAADAEHGRGKTTANYILKSGNRCRITAVH